MNWLALDIGGANVKTADGRGFARDYNEKRWSLGILGMKERALLVGGTVEIDSVYGEGTEVVVRVPCCGVNRIGEIGV